MPSQVLAIAATEGEAEVVVTDAPVMLVLMGTGGLVPDGARVDILVEGSDEELYKIGDLRAGVQSGSTVLYIAGTYTIYREAGAAVGVFNLADA
jgi:hypothetical protein